MSTEKNTATDAKPNFSSPEQEFFYEFAKTVTKRYFEPISCQSLMAGAVQGLEKVVGSTGLLEKMNERLIVVSPQTHQAYIFKSCSESEIYRSAECC